jgi:hypothetical protein
MQRENHEGRTDLYAPAATASQGQPWATGDMIRATREHYNGITKPNGKPMYHPGAVYNMQHDPRLILGHSDYVHSGLHRTLIENQHVANNDAQLARAKKNPRARVSRAEAGAPAPGVKGREAALASMPHHARETAKAKTQIRALNKSRGLPSNNGLYVETLASGSTKKTRNQRGAFRTR